MVYLGVVDRRGVGCYRNAVAPFRHREPLKISGDREPPASPRNYLVTSSSSSSYFRPPLYPVRRPLFYSQPDFAGGMRTVIIGLYSLVPPHSSLTVVSPRLTR